MMQAVYHGVPMVFAPFFEDQFDNAHTAKWFGIAEVVDLDLVTADELTEVLVTVMSTPRYVTQNSVTSARPSLTFSLNHNGCRFEKNTIRSKIERRA